VNKRRIQRCAKESLPNGQSTDSLPACSSPCLTKGRKSKQERTCLAQILMMREPAKRGSSILNRSAGGSTRLARRSYGHRGHLRKTVPM